VAAGPFAGEWSVHVTLLTIDASGYGILNWRTYSTCGESPPPCDIFSGNDIIDGGNATISLTAVGPNSASGEVLTTTVPHDIPLGPFTAHLDATKDLLSLSLPLFSTYPLCGTRARALPVGQQNAEGINCGA